MPAVIGGPHGRFSHRRGTDRQVWIAGGVGVAPFLSWLRALDGDLPQRVDFFYTADGEPPFADEIRAIAARHAWLHAHLIDTSAEGRLTTERVLAAVAGDRRASCRCSCAGRRGCCARSRRSCAWRACRRGSIHREYFDWR